MLEGEVFLVTDDGEERLVAGDCVGFPAGKRDGHHLQNRSERDAFVLEVGTSNESVDGCRCDVRHNDVQVPCELRP